MMRDMSCNKNEANYHHLNAKSDQKSLHVPPVTAIPHGGQVDISWGKRRRLRAQHGTLRQVNLYPFYNAAHRAIHTSFWQRHFVTSGRSSKFLCGCINFCTSHLPCTGRTFWRFLWRIIFSCRILASSRPKLLPLASSDWSTFRSEQLLPETITPSDPGWHLAGSSPAEHGWSSPQLPFCARSSELWPPPSLSASFPSASERSAGTSDCVLPRDIPWADETGLASPSARWGVGRVGGGLYLGFPDVSVHAPSPAFLAAGGVNLAFL